MICSNCQHENAGGKFCAKCGTKLVEGAGPEIAAAAPTQPVQPVIAAQSAQPNAHLENAKKVTQQYFGYFMNVIKEPFTQSKNVGSEHFVNGIITICLYALFIPLMVYLGMRDTLGMFEESPFVTFVIKPTLGYAVFIMLVATFSFAAIKLGKVQVTYQAVIARFGTFLIPFVGMFVLALVLALLQMKLFALILFIGFVGSIFTVPALTISSFKNSIRGGLDIVYGTILTYVLTFITLGIMASILLNAILDAIQNSIFGSLF